MTSVPPAAPPSPTKLDRALAYLDSAVVYAADDGDAQRHTTLVAGRSRLDGGAYDREEFARILHAAGFSGARVTTAIRSVEHPELPAMRKRVAQILRLIRATNLADNIERRERCEDVKRAGQLIAHQVARGYGTPDHDAAMSLLRQVAKAMDYKGFDLAVEKVTDKERRRST